MTATDIVIARHRATAAVVALVGTRITALMLAQGATRPTVRVAAVSQVDAMHQRGVVGYRVERVQCDYYAATLAQARAVREAAYGAGDATGLAGWSGSIGSPATQVDLIEPAGAREWFDPEERQDAIASQDYLVHYRP